MTEETSTSRPTDTSGPAPEAATRGSRSDQRLDPLSLIWRVLASPQTLIVLLGCVAVALVLGTVIPQIPAQAVDDPQTWLALQPGVPGQVSGLLYAVGLFDIYRAFWFHLLLALVGLTLFVWCVEGAGLAWKATVRKKWQGTDFVFWGRQALQSRVSSSHSTQTALSRLHKCLDEVGYGWVDVYGTSSLNLVAARRAPVLWAEPVVYGSLLAALLGMAILSIWGWQAPAWQPTPGESHTLGYGTPYALRLDEFGMQREETGHLLDNGGRVTWLQDGVAVEQVQVSPGNPITRPGVTVRHVGYMPVIRMRGQDDAGQPLAFQAEAESLSLSNDIEIAFSSADDQALVLVLGHDRFLALTVEPSCPQDRPALRLVLLEAGASDANSAEQRAQAVIHKSTSVELEDLDLEVEMDYRPIFRADHRPGAGLILVGMIVALMAMVTSWLVRPRLLWVAVGTDEADLTLVQILALSKARGSLWRIQLAARLEEMLSDDG